MRRGAKRCNTDLGPPPLFKLHLSRQSPPVGEVGQIVGANATARPLAVRQALFGAALLLGAALVFWAELLSSRLLLPLLGGGASVWNTALVFFQVALLGGYLYAHASVRWGRSRFVALLHPALLVAAALFLPITAPRLSPPGGANPILWQLSALALMVGAPFVVLAGTASLLQSWFARLDGPAARDPYFLYAASNLGSLGALVSYPTLIEPNLSLVSQGALWTVGYLALAALVLACAIAAIVAPRNVEPAEPEDAAAAMPALDRGWQKRARWLVLAFVPSSLLLGVTSHLTMNIAAAPLFWAIPLALYLLSFVLAFQTLVPLPERWTSWLQAVLMAALALTFLSGESGPSLPLFGLNLAAFFATALLCHQMLARLRPPPARLTEFYLFVALGGALGGVFNALIAPVVFSRVIEYPLILVLACMLRPGRLPDRKDWPAALLDTVLPALLLGGILALMDVAKLDFTDLNGPAQVIVLLIGLVVFALQARPLRFALTVGALIVAGAGTSGELGPEIAHARNFYGILRVDNHATPPMRVLINGTIEHGAQSLDPARRLQPLSYYHPAGPLGQLFARIGGGPLTQDVAVVGLGAGSVACYAHAGERWTFFEINPAVVAIARNPALFTFLRDCPARPTVVLGDARLSLERQPNGAFGVIILDAFSSDAIPTHMLTREAMQLYLAKLKPDGLVVFHISNQFLDLAPVVEGIAHAEGLTARLFSDPHAINADSDSAAQSTDYQDASDWVVVARSPADLAPIANDTRWRDLSPSPRVRVWTDDYADVFDAFLRRQEISPSP